MIGDQGRVPVAIAAERDEVLVAGRNRGALAEDAQRVRVVDDGVFVSGDGQQKGFPRNPREIGQNEADGPQAPGFAGFDAHDGEGLRDS